MKPSCQLRPPRVCILSHPRCSCFSENTHTQTLPQFPFKSKTKEVCVLRGNGKFRWVEQSKELKIKHWISCALDSFVFSSHLTPQGSIRLRQISGSPSSFLFPSFSLTSSLLDYPWELQMPFLLSCKKIGSSQFPLPNTSPGPLFFFFFVNILFELN